MSGENNTNTHENWDGPPANVTVILEEEDDYDLSKEKLWHLVCMEARSVSVWALVAPLLRIALALCGSVEWIRSLFPHGVTQDMVPGFLFSSAWLLFAVRDRFGPVPNVPIRICETVMGRLTLGEMCVVVPIHFVCALSTFVIVKLLLPSDVASLALTPIVYSHDNPWFVDFMREVIINAAFTVSFLVLPELFTLNNLPRFLSVVVMYPLYSFAVDAKGKGSTFGPNVLYALGSMEQFDGLGQAASRFMGVVVGGVIGGEIMRQYFPDDP